MFRRSRDRSCRLGLAIAGALGALVFAGSGGAPVERISTGGAGAPRKTGIERVLPDGRQQPDGHANTWPISCVAPQDRVKGPGGSTTYTIGLSGPVPTGGQTFYVHYYRHGVTEVVPSAFAPVNSVDVPANATSFPITFQANASVATTETVRFMVTDNTGMLHSGSKPWGFFTVMTGAEKTALCVESPPNAPQESERRPEGTPRVGQDQPGPLAQTWPISATSKVQTDAKPFEVTVGFKGADNVACNILYSIYDANGARQVAWSDYLDGPVVTRLDPGVTTFKVRPKDKHKLYVVTYEVQGADGNGSGRGTLTIHLP